ncbi:hypothetical protein CIRMBP1210_01520 [Enterococcus cecorum]|nr:hypothetical protein CIRMBP1210_01520 [Enterococcus cecorum]
MAKALIIGAGGVASVAVHKCVQNSEVFEEICIASRTKSKCDALKEKLDGQGCKISTAKVDANNVEELIALIEDFNPDIVINLALPYQDLTIMDACLATKTHYLDTANYEPEDTAKFEYKWQWEYREKFEKAGITAILGSGFDPGVTVSFQLMHKNITSMKFTKLIFLTVMLAITVIHLRPTLTQKSISVKSLQKVATGKMVIG